MGAVRSSVLGTVVLCLACTACGSSPEAATETSPVAEAELWLDGFVEALHTRVADLAPFVAPEVVHDARNLGGERTDSRRTYVQEWRILYGPAAEEVRVGEAYLDATGVVAAATVADAAHVGLGWDYPYLTRLTLGEDGLEHQLDLRSTSLLVTNPYLAEGGRQFPADADAEALAHRYVQGWAGGDRQALYAADAVLTDTTTGRDLRGRDQILAAAPLELALDTVARHHGSGTPGYDASAPAVYSDGRRFAAEALREVWLLARSTSGCPGRLAVGLVLDEDGRIVSERRMQAVGSVRECVQGTPTGWWTGRGLPDPLRDRVTGTVLTDAGRVEIRNGQPGLDDAVAWALGRFQEAGLAAPPVASVAFDPYDRSCEGALGLSTFTGATTDVLVCTDPETLCRPGACVLTAADRRLILHEVAHAWVNAYVPDDVAQRLVTMLGLEGWESPAVPWAERGIEWAAETIAWGLHDEPTGLLLFGDPGCRTLTDAFAVLTGAEPLHGC